MKFCIKCKENGDPTVPAGSGESFSFCASCSDKLGPYLRGRLDAREVVVKALNEAIEKEYASVERLRKRGSMDPDFDGSAIVEAAERAFES